MHALGKPDLLDASFLLTYRLLRIPRTMAPAIVEKILHPNKTKEENATSHSLKPVNHDGPVQEIERENQILGNPHHGNKHDKNPTEPKERVEHPIGFGQPGYPEGNPGQGAAGVGMMQFGS